MVQVYIAALLCVAAGFGSVFRFVAGVDEMSFLGVIISLARWAPVTYAAYIVTNQIAAHKRPPEAAGIDFIFSLLASIPMTFSAWHVWKASPVTSLQAFVDLPMDVIMLLVATVYSWVDISVNQLEGWRQALAVLGKTVFTSIVVASIVLLVIFITGSDFPKLKEQVFAPSPAARPLSETACRGKYEFTGYFTDGKKIYLCKE